MPDTTPAEDHRKNVVELQIEDRRSFANGQAFGDGGAYERLVGRADFAVDPTSPEEAGIVDLDLAPRNPDGLVEFSSDLCILRPESPITGNRRVFFDYGNRGNKRALQYYNDAPANNDPITLEDAGNGYLLRRGYTVVWAGWQADLLPGTGRMGFRVPVAEGADGPITGLVRSELITSSPGVSVLPLSGSVSTHSYPTASLDPRSADLTRRRYPDDPAEPIAPEEWAFARIEEGAGVEVVGKETAVLPSDAHIHLKTGFEPGWIYELTYTAREPLVVGLAHVAVRDLVSFLRYDESDANPLAGRTDKAYAWGRSQSGRCIRDFLHRGYNADGRGRKVFDGVIPHVSGAGLMWFDRFASVGTMPGQEYEKHDNNPSDRFPFSYATCTDHLTGVTDGILTRPESDPLVMHTQTASEYWQRRGSLVHTDTLGNDLPQPEKVRIYFWSSSQHLANPLLDDPAVSDAEPCQNLQNVVATSALFRGALDALDAWATHGTEPPASRIPVRAEGTLVTAEDWREQFPGIPGVMVPRAPNDLRLLDFEFRADEDGVMRPQVVDEDGYMVLIPATDEDGNDVAGVRAPMVQAPLGTYTGWNLRKRGHGHGAMYMITGSYLPFPETPTERTITGDPRASILERYEDKHAYRAAIQEAAQALADARLIPPEDVERAAQTADNWGQPRHVAQLP